MPNEEHACLTRAWQMICQLICLLQIHVPRLSATSDKRWAWLHLTRVAESLVRRWLVLKACQLEVWPTARSPVSPQMPAEAGVDGEKRASTAEPQFRLAEPESPLPVFVFHPATDTEPGRHILQYPTTGAGAAPPQFQSAFNPKTLQRRCASLSAVMADPETHTLRMARWLSRAEANRQAGLGRRHPTRTQGPPGASRQQRRRDPERQDMLYWIDHLAYQAVRRRTSHHPPPQAPAQAGVHGPMFAD